jgi:hypothetical protein
MSLTRGDMFSRDTDPRPQRRACHEDTDRRVLTVRGQVLTQRAGGARMRPLDLP